jgi:hypothetical protein
VITYTSTIPWVHISPKPRYKLDDLTVRSKKRGQFSAGYFRRPYFVTGNGEHELAGYYWGL